MDNLSRGARRCLQLLRSYAARSGRAFPYQAKLAAQLDVKPRMVRYYLAELKAAGFVEKVLKRQHSSAEYCLSGCQSDCRSGPPYPITDLKPSITSEQQPRKPMGVEIPEEWIDAGGSWSGRMVRNPAFDRYVKLANSHRVRNAVDPSRYLAAVWERRA